MPNFVLRIELNGTPPAGIYAELHSVMEKCNASRTIEGDDGIIYSLPHATYVGSSYQSAVEVRRALLPNVQAIWRDCDLIAFRYDDAAWQLEPYARPGLPAA